MCALTLNVLLTANVLLLATLISSLIIVLMLIFMLVRFSILMILFVVTADRGIIVSLLMLILPLITRAVLTILLLLRLMKYQILEPDLNFSDHLPIAVSVACSISTESKNTSAFNRVSSPDQLHLRWDKTDLNSYYFFMGHYLQPYFSQLEDAVKSCDNIPQEMIDTLYNNIISVLIAGAKLYVPVHQKNFL